MENYIEFVENLAIEKKDEIFFNSGPQHAAVVMSRIFKYSERIVRIFCGGFNGSVSNNSEYLKYLTNFLENGGELQVLVENDLSKGDGKIFKILKNYSSRVQMYISASRVSLGNKQIHFAVGDEKMLRIETGINDYSAQVNFGNYTQAKVFTDIFDKIFISSKENAKSISLAS